MKPPPLSDVVLDDDPINALLDLLASPQDGDDRIAIWLETMLHNEQKALAALGDTEGFNRAKARSLFAATCRARICDALLTADGRKAA